MALAAGTRLGPYEIVAALGAGGMGEVYQARDTRLDRTVAIKVLPPELSTDPERRARFEREARTIAALNHPHICTLFDVGEHDGTTYLVMEHLAGETLAQRLRKGALPVPQALEIGAQVADGLDVAHKHGIVHRDLKPANVMLTKGGAKLLDFGLAKLRPGGAIRLVPDSSATATQTGSVTVAGTLVGTIPYMAPEQVEGREADARTDLWALGCLLYEMVAGQRAFAGETPGTLIGAILAKEPEPLSTRQPLTPPGLERLVTRCLAKDPDQRWDSAHDVADELRWIAQTTSGATPGSGVGAAGTVAPGYGRRGRAVALAAAGLILGVMLGALLVWKLRPVAPGPAPPVVRSLVGVQPAEELNAGGVAAVLPTELNDGGVASVYLPTPGGSRTALAWTPDGRALVFVGRRAGAQQLYVRVLDGDEARPLAGTEDAQVPAISPDGQRVAFWARSAIRTVPLAGGPTSAVIEPVAFPPMGMDWGEGGLLYHQGERIWRWTGGQAPQALTTLQKGELVHVLPHWLPGARAFSYTARAWRTTWGDERVVVQRVTSGERRVLLQNAVDARAVPGGHLVFLRLGTLFAVPFDTDTLETHGEPVALVSGVAQALTSGHTFDVTGAGQYSVAATGHLAYLAGGVVPNRDARLVTVDRDGRVTSLPAPVRSYVFGVRGSTDGRRLAVVIGNLTNQSLWLFDLSRSVLTKVSTDGEVDWAVWTPDGRRVAFLWRHDGRPQLAWQPADGSGAPENLADGVVAPSSWAPDGKELVAVKNLRDIVVVAWNGTPQVRPVVATPAAEGWPALSPDGRWLAYASDVSGRVEVYVQPYPGPGARIQVSVEGGSSPAWNPSGRELFFVAPADTPDRGQMMLMDVDLRGSLRLGTPRRLFEFRRDHLRFRCNPVRCYDVAPDGRRFFVTQTIAPPPTPPVTQANLVFNWLEELKAKVPSGTR